MKFAQFPNGKVWRLSRDGSIAGSVLVPDYEALESLEDRLDAISEAATGSRCGLTNFSYRFRGDNVVSFAGWPEEQSVGDEGLTEPGFKVLDVNDAGLETALVAQYGLLPVEARHALDNLENDYGEECITLIAGSHRQIHCSAHPEGCGYVRVTVGGLEIAYWHMDEWRDDPETVMGAFLGAVHG